MKALPLVLAASLIAASALADTAATGLAGQPRNWSDLRSPDPARYRANLESIGFPPALITAVLRAERRLSDPLRNEPVRRTQVREPATFWETCAPWNDLCLSHVDVPPPWSPAQKTAARRLTSEYYSLWRGLDRGEVPHLSLDERLAWQAKETAMLDRLAAELGEAPRDEYLLWCSPLAQRMRHELRGFHPTEHEFRSIYRLRRSFYQRYESHFSEKFSDNPHRPPSELRERARLETEQKRRLAETMGPERHRAYERTQSVVFGMLVNVSTRHRLDEQTLHDIWLLRDVASAENQRIATDYDTPVETRRRQLAELADILVECLRDLAGPDAADAVAEQVSGWFDPMRQGLPVTYTPNGSGGRPLSPTPPVRNPSAR